jgi:hypothetical protein
MVIWALISEGCRETVDLYLTEKQAHADLADALRDEPEWSGLLTVIRLDFGASRKPCVN